MSIMILAYSTLFLRIFRNLFLVIIHDKLICNGAEVGVAVEPEAVFHGWRSARRECLPERLEPSLSSGALAEEEGLDRFVLFRIVGKEGRPIRHFFLDESDLFRSHIVWIVTEEVVDGLFVEGNV